MIPVGNIVSIDIYDIIYVALILAYKFICIFFKIFGMAKNATIVKKDRFKAVASRRVQRVLDDIDNLCKCANKNTYEYSDEDVKKMLKAINEKVTI